MFTVDVNIFSVIVMTIGILSVTEWNKPLADSLHHLICVSNLLTYQHIIQPWLNEQGFGYLLCAPKSMPKTFRNLHRPTCIYSNLREKR